jgi:hypothetical protein
MDRWGYVLAGALVVGCVLVGAVLGVVYAAARAIFDY